MTPTPAEPSAPALVREAIIRNKKGLHARAAAKLVRLVDRFDCEVEVGRGGETVPGGSIMGLLMLAAVQGASITLTARGPEASEALEAIIALIEDCFGEGC